MAKQEFDIPDLTPEQIDAITATRLESLKDADWIPYPIYRAMMHMAVRYTVELALVKPVNDSSAEVLLIQRPVDDEDIPNQWHIPGSGVKLQDPVEDYYDNNAALDRIMTKEVGGDLQITGNPVMLDTVRRKEYGLSEVTTQYWAKVLGGDQENGQFFDIDQVLRNPPDGGLVITHDDTIRKVAADHYQSLRTDV